MNNTTNLSSLIWSSADDVLRGLFKPSEYGRVILPFVVMRRLDCVLEPKKDEVYELYNKFKDQLSDPSPVILRQVGLPFFNTSKFDLSRIKSDPTNVMLNFNNYVQGYSKNVLDIIENFSISPLVEKLHKNKRLYLLIDKFTEFDLHPEKIDNHQMGTVYEELLRKFSEMSNEESGDHFTPRDVVELLVRLVFEPEKDHLIGDGIIRSVYDPCCGTGGMLTLGKEWLLQNVNNSLKIELYGQELNDVTYSICKSDFLLLGENDKNIHGPISTLSDDRLDGSKFDYLITNPPFGVSWKSDEDFVKNENKSQIGRFNAGVPGIKDGSLLFLQHLISKMNPERSRVGLILNGSPLSSGDAQSGDSEIRRSILELDLLESIICLPDNLFFNTDITTYIWILSNKKDLELKGKINLIDASHMFEFLKQPLGDKKKIIPKDLIDQIVKTYKNHETNSHSKLVNKNEFFYKKYTIETPEFDSGGNPVTKRDGTLKADSAKRDVEYIPDAVHFDKYFYENFKKYNPDVWVDKSKTKVGCEIGFNRYFHLNEEVMTTQNTLSSLNKINTDIDILQSRLNDILNQSETVLTKGFSDLEMVETGIDWISKIPSHWKVEPLYLHFYDNKEKNTFNSMDVLTLSYGKIKYRDLSKNFGLLPESFSTYQVVSPEMIIIRPTDLQNDKKSLRVGHSKLNGVITSAYIGLHPHKAHDTRYFYYYLHLCDLKKVFYGLGSGLRQSLSYQDFKRFPLIVPPLDEQVLISDYLESADEILNQISALEKERLDLIEQLKRSMVSDLTVSKV